MNVQVDARGERLIEEQLRTGRYRSAEEVVAHALDALPEVEERDSERSEAVREMLEFATRHNFTLGEDLSARDLVREGRKR